MGSGASVTSPTYIFKSKAESKDLQNSNENEHSQKCVYSNTTNQKKCSTDFKKLGSNFVRNLLRSEFDLPLNLQTPQLSSTLEKEAQQKEEPKSEETRPSLVLLPTRSSQYFKNLILMGDPDTKNHEPNLDPSGDVNRAIKTFSIPTDKLTKLKFLSI
ncbi:uncharacterized protein LOC106661067 isoform X2 [Cimex lectularius]|nr:uncharacterized protein LOC106661067 isoform X2 [Cimex lectularius]